MPRYLALDYAYEAIKEHQNFLSVFLLTLPSSPELFGHYGLSGNDDYSYRSPWMQVKEKGTHRSFSYCEGLQETLRHIVPSASPQGLESISDSGIYVIPSEDDIIPSSNPDSPPLDSQTKHSIQSELQHLDLSKTPSDIEGHFVKEEEGDFDGHGTGREHARYMLEDLFDVTSVSRRHQTCEEMCTRLFPMTIKDPFANLPPEQGTEKLQLRANIEESITAGPCTELSKDLEIFPDVWKDQETCKEEEFLLPELVSSSDALQCTHPPVCEVMPDHCLRLKQEGYPDKFDWSEGGFLDSVSTGTNTCSLHQEQLPQISTQDGDPVKLNHTGLASLDHKEKPIDLDQGSLEPPRTPIDASKSAKDKGQEHTKLPMTPISCFDAEIVTPNTKEKAENRMWKTEQCLHEAIALSLKVPDMQSSKTPNPVPSPKSQLGLTKEHGNSDVDLLVPWQPVNISQVLKNKKFSKSLEDLGGSDKTKMLDSAEGSDQEPVTKQELSIGGDECDKLLEPLGIELEGTLQNPLSHISESQIEEPKEHSCTVPKAFIPKDEKPLCEGRKGRTEDVRPKKHSMGDPLMDFLKLRCKESLIQKERDVRIQKPSLPPLLPVANKNDTEIQLPTKGENDSCKTSNPVTIKNETICRDRLNESELTPTKSGNKKSKSRMVVVILTGPFLEMVKVIEDALAPVVSYLHSTNALSPSYTLRTLTTDVTRFLLLQHEKQNCSSTDKDDTERYKHIILLHSYVTAIDLMINCDAVSAIMHLALTNERYRDILKGCLDSVRKTLFKKQCLLPKHTLHPKLHEMARLTGEWFLKKLKKEGRDHDPKVLVIIRREYSKLAENVTCVLLSVKGLSASTLCSTPQTTYVRVSEALDKHNCLVITPKQIDESFPWAHFSLVIEYEASTKSPWKELCLRQKIRHIELKCVSHDSSGANLGHLSTADGANEKKADDKPKQIPLKLIGSENIINSSKLLHMLETKYNILIVERTSASHHNSSVPRHAQADLVLDERTGIIIVELESLLGEGAVEPLVHRITMLSQQFCMLWVILEGNGQSNRYALGGHVVINTCKLQSALSQFTAKSHDFEVKVMYSNDSISTASTIDMISDVARKASAAVWHCDDWLTRPWLTDRLSKHEKFLTGFPCVNSFSAQVMLTAAPLPMLLSAPLTYLTKLCPWIPKRIISNFYKVVHDESPFCDHPSKVCMEQRREESMSDQAKSTLQERSDTDQRNWRAMVDEGLGATGGRRMSHGQEDGLDKGSSTLHGRKGRWSMLQSERDSRIQYGLRQLHQDTPVKVKSEPVEDSPVYDLADSEILPQGHYVPDDLKTPLELIASSDSIRDDLLGLSRYHLEKFDAEDAMTSDVDLHPTRDVLHQLDPKRRSGQSDLSSLLSYSSAAKPGNIIMPSQDWTMDKTSQPSQQSGIRTSARHSYSGLGESVLPSHHPDIRCQEWDLEQALTKKQVTSDYFQKGQIQFPGQSASVSAQRKNTRPHEMDAFPHTLKQAPRKYIGIAQPCPRVATDNALQKTFLKSSSCNMTSRSGEFGTLATSGLPARRGSSSGQNQNEGYFPGQRHPQKYPSQQEQQHHREQTLHSRDDYWDGGRDAVMLPRPRWLQGQASSYQYQRGDAIPDTGKLSCMEDFYTDGPTKRRRLTCERVPGSKGGQTRLAFR